MKPMKFKLKNVLAKMNNFDLLKDILVTFPVKFIEDFAVANPAQGGPNYEAVEDHVKTVHNADEKQIEEIRLHLAQRKKETYSLCEAVADIAYIAGVKGYYGGDSRQDVADFISWAKEFEYINRGVEWGVEKEYLDEIDAFTDKKTTKEV